MAKATDLNNTGVYLDVVPIGNGFKMEKFYKDLVQLADDEHPLDDTPGAERIDELLRVTRKRIHKKRSIGRVTFMKCLREQFSIRQPNLPYMRELVRTSVGRMSVFVG